MHPYTSTLVAASHINDLHAEAAAERLARSTRTPNLGRNRLTGAVASVWSFLAGSADATPALPKLTDYPFRG